MHSLQKLQLGNLYKNTTILLILSINPNFSFSFLNPLTLWDSDQLRHIPHPWGDEAVLETQVPCVENGVDQDFKR